MFDRFYKKISLGFLVCSFLVGCTVQASEDVNFISQTSSGKSFTMKYGADFLFGFLPMPVLEADIGFNKLHIRLTTASSLVWGRFAGGLAYDLAHSKGPALYFDAGVFYAGVVYGHLYEGGVEFRDVSFIRSDLRLGVAVHNTDSTDPWNGRQVDATRVLPRIGLFRAF